VSLKTWHEEHDVRSVPLHALVILAGPAEAHQQPFVPAEGLEAIMEGAVPRSVAVIRLFNLVLEG
jgi:hypothetical protein